AGARAIVVFNDGAAANRIAPQTMVGIGDDVTIPGVMISHPSGAVLVESLEDGAEIYAALNQWLGVPADPGDDDTLAWFTSRGPGQGGSVFKPSLAAPGRFVRSAEAGTGMGSRVLNGTSMAAPHVAGASALLREREPQLSPTQIMALLQSSAVAAHSDGPGSNSPYPLALQGSGVLRLDRAISQQALPQPAAVSFGRLQVEAPIVVTQAFSLWNRAAESRDYAVSHEPVQALSGVDVNCPDAPLLEPGASAELEIGLTADPAAMPSDFGSQNQTEVDGWCVYTHDEETVRVAYMAIADPMAAVSVSTAGAVLQNDGPASGRAEPFLLLAHNTNMSGGDAAIGAFGLRPVEYAGFPLIEFAIALHQPWEHPSTRDYEIYIDSDEDGRDDFLLRIVDWSRLGGTPGSLITLQYELDEYGRPDPEAAYLDWIFSSVDYNDQVLIAPFTQVAPAGTTFLQPGDTNFGWRLVVRSRAGNTRRLQGSVDFSNYSGSPAVTVQPGQQVAIDPATAPELWLFGSNATGKQYQVTD
ncbi:MAG: S8 family serine peptidase, partial [Gammaproteobacteria bacterium]|nr:S8 family serine peptidase [Gammaproteobacteria bacterium]